VILTDTLPQST